MAAPDRGAQIAARTAAFITRNAQSNRPFFTYVCFTWVHPALLPHPDFTGKSGGGDYSDTLAELDYRTGQVLDVLRGLLPNADRSRSTLGSRSSVAEGMRRSTDDFAPSSGDHAVQPNMRRRPRR